ncbi:MAG: DUF6069 family protein [Candidatus Nanopelagicales bacterium]|nr:DUF6069 family protein [Candidatus Nanopelagicales bacterium]MCU0294674.1 DUF6069 family protein [Candidatus Nanopelagicales bacterium]MCU0299789.1 DUF6069 family protein [Candidatus Nanopelagicales bacterium]
MSFDPDALSALAGPPKRPQRRVTLPFLIRLGVAAGLAAAVCNVVVLLIAQWQGWSTSVEATSVSALSVILVCLIVGCSAALGAYAAARVTKHPPVWVALSGAVLLLASLTGLPRSLQAMHLITGAWVITALTRAVRRGSHLS